MTLSLQVSPRPHNFKKKETESEICGMVIDDFKINTAIGLKTPVLVSTSSMIEGVHSVGCQQKYQGTCCVPLLSI